MNICVYYKEEIDKENILSKLDTKNNLIYCEKSIFKVISMIKEKDIQGIITINNFNAFFKLVEYLYQLPILLIDESNINNIERILQHKIAYKRRKEIPVLMYHRVISSEKEKGIYDTYVTKENFEEQMRYLKENNYESITFEDIKNGEYKKRFDRNKKYIIITFDDGYKDNYTNVLPILKKYNMKISLFMVTDLNYNKWDADVIDREKEKKFELLSKEELKEMLNTGLIEIGSHTTTHINMQKCDKEFLNLEIKKQKIELEKLTGKKIISFSYPWGKVDDKSKKILKENDYMFAVSVESGTTCFSDDFYEIRRREISSTDTLKHFKRKIDEKYFFKQDKKKRRRELKRKIKNFFK